MITMNKPRLRLEIRLPYGKPPDYDELTFEQQWFLMQWQFKTKEWHERVMTRSENPAPNL